MEGRPFINALGTPLTVTKPQERIVSLIPSITELLFTLGLDERIVGVTRFCTHPPAGVAKKIKVGGGKDPDLQKILDWEPGLVIANIEENGKEHIEVLRAAGIPVFVTYPRTVREGIELIVTLGGLTDTQSTAVKCTETPGKGCGPVYGISFASLVVFIRSSWLLMSRCGMGP